MIIPLGHLISKYGLKPAGVFHIGASTGHEIFDYASHGFTPVVWVEALPDVFEKLKINIAKHPDHVALCACLSDKDNENVVFHRSSNAGESSSFLALGSHATAHPDVRYIEDIPMVTERADTMLCRNGIAVGPGWFLNIDVQGCELLVLRGLGDLIKQFDFAYLEINTAELYKNCAFDTQITAFMEANGFVEVFRKMTNHQWGDAAFKRKTP